MPCRSFSMERCSSDSGTVARAGAAATADEADSEIPVGGPGLKDIMQKSYQSSRSKQARWKPEDWGNSYFGPT